MTATITSKGQIVLPKPIRDLLRLGAGDKVDFIVQENGDILVRPLTSDFRSLKGMVQHRRKTPVSLEEMQQAIHRGASRGRRGLGA